MLPKKINTSNYQEYCVKKKKITLFEENSMFLNNQQAYKRWWKDENIQMSLKLFKSRK